MLKKSSLKRLGIGTGIGIAIAGTFVAGIASATPILTTKCEDIEQIFAIPPPLHEKREIVACQRRYATEPPMQMCIYSDGRFCTIMIDVVGEEKWRGQDIDCTTGEPIDTKTAF